MNKEETKMKKAMALISLTVLVVLIFASCANEDVTGVNTDIVSDTAVITNNESKVEYNVFLYSNYLYKLFKKETPKSTGIYEMPTKYDGEYEIKQVGDIQLEMKLVEKETGHYQYISCYLLKNGEHRVSIFDNNANDFALSAAYIDKKNWKKGFLKEYQEDELSEEKLIKHCKDYIAEFDKDIDYSLYTYYCITSFEEPDEYYSGKLWREGFYEEIQVENVTLKPRDYTLKYKFKVGEYFTSNLVHVTTNENGDIQSIRYTYVEADWSKYALENEELTKIAKDFLDKYLVEDCKLISYETTPYVILITKNYGVRVKFYLDITVEYEGKIISGTEELTIVFPDEITGMESCG